MFTADPEEVFPGGSTTVRWSVENAVRVTLDGTDVKPQGEREISDLRVGPDLTITAEPVSGPPLRRSLSIKLAGFNAPPGPPLSLNQVRLLLESKIRPALIQSLATIRRTAFALSTDPEAQASLITAGAPVALISTLRRSHDPKATAGETSGLGLSLEDLELLTRMRVSAPLIHQFARDRKLDFPMDAAAGSRLAAAGAGQELITQLAIISPPVRASVRSPEPPKERPPEAPKEKVSAPPQPPRNALPQQVETNPRDGLAYTFVPSGKFMMGCSDGDKECKDKPDETPAHEVSIRNPFWLGRTEVTVEAYARSGQTLPAGARNPKSAVTGVTWEEAATFCAWAGGRLPTEAEWEYASRAGDGGIRPVNLDAIAWHQVNSAGRLPPAGVKHPNRFNVFDMLGGALEWVNDYYSKDAYSRSPFEDPPGPSDGSERVARGGSFTSKPLTLRYSARDHNAPAKSFPNLGFRCVWGPAGQ